MSLLAGCASVGPDQAQKMRRPKSHILSSDKKVMKDNLKYHKEHQKAAQKKREELATYLQQNNVTTEKTQKKYKK